MNFHILSAEFIQSLRSLLRRPGYFLLALATLALGVATTTSVFSLLYQSVLRPLPFQQSEQLATLGLQREEGGNIGAQAFLVALTETESIVRSVGIVSAYPGTVTLSNGDLPVVGTRLSADHGFLATLQVRMALGRNFNREEDAKNGPPAAILSYRYWRQHFGGDSSVIGKTLQIEGKSVPVVGVLPEGFVWPARFDVLTAMQIDADAPGTATNEYVVARLAGADASISERFDARMREYITRKRSMIGEDAFAFLERQRFDAQPLKHLYTRAAESTLWMFFAAACCVLLIAAINLTNLMALRAIARSHDTAVRAALGAPRIRLVTPSLAEGVAIGIAGCLAGLFLAWAGLRVLDRTVPPEWLRGADIEFGATTVAFSFLAGIVVALFAAVLAVVRGQRQDLAQELSAGARGGWTRGASLLGRSLVIAQTAIAMLLLLVSALFGRTLYQLVSTPMGFESRAITTFTLSPNPAVHPDILSVDRQTTRILERLSNEPGVLAVSASTNLPTASELNLPAELADGRTINPEYRPSTPALLDVFSIRMLSGRWITSDDDVGAESVCVVNRAFAETYLNGRALGAVFKSPSDLQGGMRSLRVVGVVDDVRQFGPEQPAPPIVYVPLAQVPDEIWSAIRGFLPLSYAVRTRGDVQNIEGALRRAIAEIEPQQPITGVKPMQAVVASTTDAQRLNMLLVGLFAALSLLLAIVGLYAVTSVATMARMREFGIRAALGASPRRLLVQVVKEGAAQIGIGLALGLVTALALSGVIRRYLFGVEPTDPVVIAVVLVTLLLAGISATLPPALRAARVDPIRVLRAD